MLSIDDQGPWLPCPTPFNLAEHVLWSSGAVGDKTAMSVLSNGDAEHWSYNRLRDAVLRAGAGLLAEGALPGDRIALRLGNVPAFPITFLGAIAAGLLPVPISAALTETEADRILAVVKPKVVVGATGIAPEQLQTASPLARTVQGDPNRPAYIIFTSGTSGKPMGVVHAHRAIWARQAMITGWYDLSESDRMLHAGAFNWTYTLGTGLCDPWSVGATALVPADGTDPALLPMLLERHDATIFAAAPGIYRRLVRDTLPPLPNLRHALSAGEKLPTAVAKAWNDATQTEIHEAFGQSECSTFISASPDRPAPDTALGYAQPGRRVAILENGNPVPRGTSGDIAIGADDPGVMLGYLDDQAATDARFAGNWFLTGDTGSMADDGAITYEGRRDDILTAGGYRISPVEVENAMLTHPAIDDAATVDETLDEKTRVVALHYAAAAPVPDEVLQAHAARHLARYKQPRVFYHHESLPRGAGGKLLRRALRAETQDI